MEARISKEINSGSFTVAEFRGAEEYAVMELVDKYLRRYPVEGYATTVSSKHYDDNGEYVAMVRRYSSCD